MPRLVLVLTCLGLVALGCGTGAKPQVTFSADAASATAAPTQYCDQELKECSAESAAVVTLAVPPGTAVRVSVPPAVSEAPWHVVFSYLTAAGERVDGRSPLVPAGQRSDLTLTLPAPTDQLVRAEVQQFAAGLLAEAGGEISFPIRASWVLVVAD